MGTPLVTALIDTYNHGRFIETAIESVLNQDFPRAQMDVLVIDDGSTDDTSERIKKFGDSIRYIRKANGGQASAFNMGLDQAKGEIILLLDGDDWWLPKKTQRIVDEFEKNPRAGMAYHRLLLTHQEEGVVHESNPAPISGFVPRSRETLLLFHGVPTSCLAFRRSTLAPLLPVPTGLTILADGYLVYLAVFVTEVIFLSECLAHFRFHDGNLFNFSEADPGRLLRKLECQTVLVQEIEKWLQGKGYDLQEPNIASYVKRERLTAEAIRWALTGGARRDYFDHLRQEARLYRHMWTLRYRTFKLFSAILARVLGHDAFTRVRARYSNWPTLGRLRQIFCPIYANESKSVDVGREAT